MNVPVLLKARQTKYAAYATLYVVVVLAVLTVANVLGDRYNKTYDSTANKRFSLSEQTAKIVKGLKDPATIYYYDRPTGFKQAKDTLDQYANLSPKVHVEYVDLEKNPLAAREAGIRSLGTAIVQIGSRKEEAKGLNEEGVTGAFIRDLKSTTRTICFVTGSGEHQIDETGPDGYSRFKDLLGKD
ncbi:MAG TPA: Gldg family protein, partial [Candidatus Acidoferrum sp.]|nr:Gldg family protein [Candidatus Acidoferrum sp.]